MSCSNSARPADGDRSALMNAATNGDTSEVKRLLRLDSCQDTWTCGGLTHAVELPESDRIAVRELLDLNISPDDLGHQKDFEALHVVWKLGNECVNTWILADIESQLRRIADRRNGEKLDLRNVMHLVAFVRVPGLMTILAMQPKFLNINVENATGQTPLHMAALTGNVEAVEVLTGQPNLAGALEDKLGQTALELAYEIDWEDIARKLQQRRDIQDYLVALQAERTFLVGGANATLVGAALIASVTFIGWLQPPLGYQQNYKYPRVGGPSDQFEQYAAINEYGSIKVFWIANSLSFYLSIATVLAATASAVPLRDYFIRGEVKRLRSGIHVCGFLFSWSVLFVLIAFTAAGYAAVPPEIRYKLFMICTVVVGVLVGWIAFILTRTNFSYIWPKYADPTFYFDILLEKTIGQVPAFYQPGPAIRNIRRTMYKSHAAAAVRKGGLTA